MHKNLFKAFSCNCSILRNSYSLWLFLLLQFGLLQVVVGQSTSRKGNDGPYLLYQNEQVQVIRVDEGKLVQEPLLEDSFEVRTDDGKHAFQVSKHAISVPQAIYKQQGDVMVLSDPHGDFDSFYSLLQAHRVVGAAYQWTYGNKHLVVIGDVFDRGNDVLAIYWLLYKLEEEARLAGGTVHFLLGNHEEMVLRGDLRYAEEKYTDLAKELRIDYMYLWSSDSELGRWVRSRNTVEKIGKHLIVHAGVSKAIADEGWTISAINDSTRSYLGHPKAEREQSVAAKFLFGSLGPLWYRGMVKDDEKYSPLAEKDLHRIKKHFQVKDIFVGHTIFPEVTSLYDGQVYAVNVQNKKNREQLKSRGVLIKGKKVYSIYDNSAKKELMKK